MSATYEEIDVAELTPERQHKCAQVLFRRWRLHTTCLMQHALFLFTPSAAVGNQQW